MQKVTSTPAAPEFPTTYTRLLARALRLDSRGERQLLAGTRLRPDDLTALAGTVGAEDQLRVIRNALQLASRPGFGLEMGNRLPLAAHGALGQLLAASPTLAEGWAALARFHALRLPLVQLRLRTQAGSVDIQLDTAGPLDEAGIFLLEVMVVTVQRGIELVTGRRLREGQLTLAYPAPAHAGLYANAVHGHIRFAGTRTFWRIPREVMDAPNPFRDDALFRETLRQCEAASLGAARRVLSPQSITALLQSQPGVLWSLVDVAAHFHVSPRTLIRHLKRSGTSWQRLLDAELARQAAELMLEQGLGVEATALAVGYRDATAFRRAFRRWTGHSPSAWLAQQNVASASPAQFRNSSERGE